MKIIKFALLMILFSAGNSLSSGQELLHSDKGKFSFEIPEGMKSVSAKTMSKFNDVVGPQIVALMQKRPASSAEASLTSVLISEKVSENNIEREGTGFPLICVLWIKGRFSSRELSSERVKKSFIEAYEKSVRKNPEMANGGMSKISYDKDKYRLLFKADINVPKMGRTKMSHAIILGNNGMAIIWSYAKKDIDPNFDKIIESFKFDAGHEYSRGLPYTIFAFFPYAIGIIAFVVILAFILIRRIRSLQVRVPIELKIICENCQQPIGKEQEHFNYKGYLVCGPCRERLGLHQDGELT